MELIVGVVHAEEFVEAVDGALKERYPSGIESLMLEIPSNWRQFRHTFEPNDKFFLELAKIYSSRGTRIIYGDSPINQSIPFTWVDLLVDRFFTHNRDKSMLKIIEKRNPQVVLVGNGHANYIKRRNPAVPYLTFRANPLSKADAIIEYLLGNSSYANQIIRLNYAHPREYYLRKHRIIS